MQLVFWLLLTNTIKLKTRTTNPVGWSLTVRAWPLVAYTRVLILFAIYIYVEI